jgi:hypothetical protein
MPAPLQELPPTDPNSGGLNVVVDTPKGSRNKYKFDEQSPAAWSLER